jgi:hypothetical protein
VECKRKGEKQKPKQLEWAARLKLQNWEVCVVYSLSEFLNAVEQSKK